MVGYYTYKGFPINAQELQMETTVYLGTNLLIVAE
jgi:hypothetical protein